LRRIDESLGVFDGRIRTEQQVLAADRSARAGTTGNGAGDGPEATGADGAGAAGDGQDGDGKGDGKGGGKNGGMKSDPGGAAGRPGAGGAGAKSGGAGQTGGQGSTGGGKGTGAGAGGGGGTGAGSGPSTIPADVPDGSDDDVVAKQIREAAMTETDPELREKLWEEYRKYKKGQ
jgi:hypothetical protein